MKANEQFFLEMVQQGVFQIDASGKIYRLKKGKRGHQPCALLIEREMTGMTNVGYIWIGQRDGKGKQLHILGHRLVWLYFNGEIPEGFEINHKNGVRTDNSPSNLELVTKSGNQIHAYDVLGKHRKPKSLSEEKVRTIKKQLSLGMSCTLLGKEFGVTHSMVSMIKSGLRWRYIQ